MNTRQIADAGTVLVQNKLLKLGLAATRSPDRRPELVVGRPDFDRRLIVKVSTNARPKPGGGKGRSALDWWVREDVLAHAVALADLSTGTAWLMTPSEIRAAAQQHSERGMHLYMYVEFDAPTRTGLPNRMMDFDRFLLERRATSLLATT